MPNPGENTPKVKEQGESAVAETAFTNQIAEKTRQTMPTVYPDLEYINRTLP
jgi:hypothetical protein